VHHSFVESVQALLHIAVQVEISELSDRLAELELQLREVLVQHLDVAVRSNHRVLKLRQIFFQLLALEVRLLKLLVDFLHLVLVYEHAFRGRSLETLDFFIDLGPSLTISTSLGRLMIRARHSAPASESIVYTFRLSFTARWYISTRYELLPHLVT
jgi:hypothetical protein